MNKTQNGSTLNPSQFANHFSRTHVLLFSVFACLLIIFLSSCTKQDNISERPSIIADAEIKKAAPVNSNADVMTWYRNIEPATLFELQQARAATARYLDINNAIADGYIDIAVDVEEMGHHYMNPNLVDGNFDLKKPELLVYNRDENGKAILDAVEYAVPVNLPRPEGFTGSADVWNGDNPFSLWLLHAWVWAYNPEGVFNPTNPLIHLH